jgi:hypothetical protein
MLFRLQSLCTNLYSTTLHNSLTAPNCTALVPIRFSTANRLLISLHYSTHKVFKSHVKSSQADFFNYALPVAISYRQLLTAMLGTLLYSRGRHASQETHHMTATVVLRHRES